MKVKIISLATLFVVFMAFSVIPVHASSDSSFEKNVYTLPKNSGFKAWMDYRTITKKDSPQFSLQEVSETGENGLRMKDGRYCVAIGTGFKAPVGTNVDVFLDTGKVLKCVVGDIKSNQHTDPETHTMSYKGNVVEFIIDIDELNEDAMYHGDISSIPEFDGSVRTLIVYKEKAVITASNR